LWFIKTEEEMASEPRQYMLEAISNDLSHIFILGCPFLRPPIPKLVVLLHHLEGQTLMSIDIREMKAISW
jgi:hypothetical protein